MIERQRPQSKASLEDLLRLKRAERPAPEFWAEFDAQLRRKQLAAIVDKRPWWRRLSAASLARISIPVGATAVIAFTVLAVRERTQVAPDIATVPASSFSAVSSVSAPAAQMSPSSAADARSSLVAAVDHASAPDALTVSIGTTSASLPAANAASSENNGSVVAIQDSPEPSLAQVILGLEGITEHDARPLYPADGVQLLGSLDILDKTRSLEISSLESSSLNQVPSSSRDDRRARLLASVGTQDRSDLVSGNSRVIKSRDRIANRLAEQSLYDSISRLGLNGDSVSIKF